MFIAEKQAGEALPAEIATPEKQILENALELLSQPGVWVNRHPGAEWAWSESGGHHLHCLGSALGYTRNKLRHNEDVGYRAVELVVSAIQRAGAPIPTWNGDTHIPHWNDAPGRTLDQVQSVLRDAIAHA